MKSKDVVSVGAGLTTVTLLHRGNRSPRFRNSLKTMCARPVVDYNQMLDE